MSTLTYSGTLTIQTCWCGMRHAVPTELIDHMRAQHRNGVTQTGIYCPLGHSWIISGPGALVREREARERAEREAANAAEETRILRAELTKAKGAANRARKRAAAGACPCCNRSFVQLARHMATKHPEHATTKEA